MNDKPCILILYDTLLIYKQIIHETLTLIPKMVRRPNIIRFIRDTKVTGLSNT